MGKEYISVETASLTGADTPVELTTLGSETGVGPVQVPSGKRKISEIIVAIASDGATTGAGVFWLRLSGKGLAGAEQQIVVGGVGGTNATSNIQSLNAQRIPVDIDVVPGNKVKVEVEANVDTGTVSIGVTLVFE